MYFVIGLFVSMAMTVAVVFLRKNDFKRFLKDAEYGEKVMLSLLIPFIFILSIIAWPMTLIAAVLFVVFTIAERD
jgi:hypothetical protein